MRANSAKISKLASRSTMASPFANYQGDYLCVNTDKFYLTNRYIELCLNMQYDYAL